MIKAVFGDTEMSENPGAEVKGFRVFGLLQAGGAGFGNNVFVSVYQDAKPSVALRPAFSIDAIEKLIIEGDGVDYKFDKITFAASQSRSIPNLTQQVLHFEYTDNRVQLTNELERQALIHVKMNRDVGVPANETHSPVSLNLIESSNVQQLLQRESKSAPMHAAIGANSKRVRAMNYSGGNPGVLSITSDRNVTNGWINLLIRLNCAATMDFEIDFGRPDQMRLPCRYNPGDRAGTQFVWYEECYGAFLSFPSPTHDEIIDIAQRGGISLRRQWMFPGLHEFRPLGSTLHAQNVQPFEPDVDVVERLHIPFENEPVAQNFDFGL